MMSTRQAVILELARLDPSGRGLPAEAFVFKDEICRRRNTAAHMTEVLHSHESTKARKVQGLVWFRVFVADRSRRIMTISKAGLTIRGRLLSAVSAGAVLAGLVLPIRRGDPPAGWR